MYYCKGWPAPSVVAMSPQLPVREAALLPTEKKGRVGSGKHLPAQLALGVKDTPYGGKHLWTQEP